MYNNCTPCRCRRMIELIRIIAQQECAKSCQSNTLNGIQAQLYGVLDVQRRIEDGEIVPFDVIVDNQSSITMSNGEFTISKAGNYFIDWEVITNGSDHDNYMSFAVTVNGVIKSQGSSNIATGLVTSSALVTLEAGDVVTLISTSGQTVAFSLVQSVVGRPDAINVQANITIISV